MHGDAAGDFAFHQDDLVRDGRVGAHLGHMRQIGRPVVRILGGEGGHLHGDRVALLLEENRQVVIHQSAQGD